MDISIEEIIKMENNVLEFNYNNLDKSNIQKRIATTIRDSLEELKQRRKSDIRPADKFLNNSLSAQMYHVESELEECIEAYENLIVGFDYCPSKQERLIEELVDLQMSCCTMLAILGLDEQQRMEARRKVIDKNRLRGYYEDGVNSES